MGTTTLWLAILSAAAASFLLICWGWARFLQTQDRQALAGTGWFRGFVLRPMGRRMEAALPSKWRGSLHRTIREAALAKELEVGELLTLQVLGGMGGATALAWLLASAWGASVGALLFGLVPFHVLRARGRQRQLAIGHELPFFLDLVTLVLEGGHDLTTAFAQTAKKLPPGPLRDELSLALRELRVGRARKEALRELGERAGSKDLERMTTTVVRADGLGAPLGPTLRALSAQLRAERFLLAEKRAGQAPVKMLFPLAFFILPAVFLVLLGPIAFALIVG